jgi:hypothetical protein
MGPNCGNRVAGQTSINIYDNRCAQHTLEIIRAASWGDTPAPPSTWASSKADTVPSPSRSASLNWRAREKGQGKHMVMAEGIEGINERWLERRG